MASITVAYTLDPQLAVQVIVLLHVEFASENHVYDKCAVIIVQKPAFSCNFSAMLCAIKF